MDFRECVCKDCKEKFYLSLGEVEFYRKKKFPLPTHCKYCKAGEKRPVEKKVEKPEVEEKIPSAMEIALKKAGF